MAATPPSDAGSSRSGTAALLLALLVTIPVTLPFLSSSFVPATDLPQHVAQLRLLAESVTGRDPGLQVGWFGPGTLAYGLIAPWWALLPPQAAGRVVLWLLAVAWALSGMVLALRRRRSPEAAILAAVLVFQASLAWGFVSFLAGWPVFVLWLLLTDSRSPPSRRQLAQLAGTALLLYLAHVLWLAAGLLWLLAIGIATRAGPRTWGARALAVAPAAALAALWYPHMLRHRALFVTGAVWLEPPWHRVAPASLVETAFGALHGPWEAILASAVAAWLALVLVTRRRELRQASDRVLLLAAALFGAIALVAPDRAMNTILFASRWMPCALALLLVGLPAPRLPRLATRLSALGVLVAAGLVTAVAWRSVERVELAGLRPALTAVPAGARVLGLDLVRDSRLVTGQPFMHMAAYAQAAGGGAINFSFAEHGSSLVSVRTPRLPPWTPGLEWGPRGVKPRDLVWFDRVLVNGAPDDHRWLQERLPGLVPVTGAAVGERWRLYAVPARIGGS